MGNEVSYYTKNRLVSYNKKRHELKTGDVLIFSGFGLDSRMVKFFTTSCFSHVGVVVYIQDESLISNELRDKDHLYLFHSTLDSYNKDVPDVISGKTKGGVQLNSLGKVMEWYKGRIILRRQSKRIQIGEDALKSIILEHVNKPYENGVSELLNSVYRGRCAPICNSDNNAFFCSELAVTFYKEVGILPRNIQPYKYIPSDFATGGYISRSLADAGYYLFQEIEIKRK
jgi:hypothetical protein